MLSPQEFWIITGILTLAEIFAICWFWERKMRQAEEQARREERRKTHEYYRSRYFRG